MQEQVNSNTTMLNYRDASDKGEFVASLELDTPSSLPWRGERCILQVRKQVIMNLADAWDD